MCVGRLTCSPADALRARSATCGALGRASVNSGAANQWSPIPCRPFPSRNPGTPRAPYDAERLEEGDARLFLSIEARDHAIGALVHDMRIYTAVEVLFGMHYAEAVTVDDQRRPVADLTRLSLVEPDPSAHPD